MRYTVHQHWDPLKVCMVGRSYPPEFYSYITNIKVRKVFEQIARETEEDYQKLIALLTKFGVKIMRPDISINTGDRVRTSGEIMPPPMTPRDYSAMIGNNFFFPSDVSWQENYKILAGVDWVPLPEKWEDIPKWQHEEFQEALSKNNPYSVYNHNLIDIKKHSNLIYDTEVNSAMCTRVGKDLYFGTETYDDDIEVVKGKYSKLFPEYRCHVINTGGHSDGTYCPVKPGLIISLRDVPTYSDTFPGWEVVYLPGQSWDKVSPFLDLKEKNKGKWWVPGQELNDEFTDFVEEWMGHWVGYVEETVFDVNMLVIDEHNVVCNNYNKQVFDALERHQVTPHVINFRHRYFWDGGLHCITSDLHREGPMKDYFPERG